MRAREQPSAVRTASSLRRASARPMSRLATLAHAISRTNPAAPSSASNGSLISPAISSTSGERCTRIRSSDDAAPSTAASICASASRGLTSGFSLA